MSPFSSFHEARLQLAPRTAVIGNFDGVHLGHKLLIERALEKPGPVVAVTFDPHPATLFQERGPTPLLTSLPERTRLLRALGLHGVVVIPFTREFSSHSPQTFIQELHRELGIQHLFIGKGFRFGKNRSGDTDCLKSLETFGIKVHVIDTLERGGAVVSSTRIRDLALKGLIEEIPPLLGRPLSLSGTVKRGLGLGKSLGFATANLEVQGLVPADGVYTGEVQLPGASPTPCLVSIGTRPTIGENLPRDCEVHIPGVTGALYGQLLVVHLRRRLREQRKFNSKDALKAAMEEDLSALRGDYD